MDERIQVRGAKLVYGGHTLGPATHLIADSSEDISGKGVLAKRQTPHRIDYIFATKTDIPLVVGIESKQLQDLISSWISGRLQRQLRTLIEVVDIPCLMLRGLRSWLDFDAFEALKDDLLKWQLLGNGTSSGYILFGPKGNPYTQLVRAREVFSGTSNLRTAVSRYEKKVVNGSVREQALQKLLRGCGPKMSASLSELGTVIDVLQADDEILIKYGANKTVLQARRELLA